MAKKKNPADLTLRNLRPVLKRVAKLEAEVAELKRLGKEVRRWTKAE